MKKTMTVAAALTVAALSANAMAGEWFAGLEGGKAYNKFEQTIAGAKDSENKVKSKFYGLRVGQYVNDNVRIYGTLSRNKFNDSRVEDAGLKQKSLILSTDYVFMAGSAIRPFVGASLGGTRFEAQGEKKSGFAYGAQAGVMYQAGPVDLELGLKYMGNSAKVKSASDAEFRVKNSRQAYLSAAYRF